jgi:serine/threonine protein kinase
MGYEVIDYIGEGAASLLYAVTHPQTAQIYALKHVTPKSDKHQRFIEQLETEYHVGQLVRHKGLRRSIEMKVNRTLFRKVTEAALVLETVRRPAARQPAAAQHGRRRRHLHPGRRGARRPARHRLRALRPQAQQHPRQRRRAT